MRKLSQYFRRAPQKYLEIDRNRSLAFAVGILGGALCFASVASASSTVTRTSSWTYNSSTGQITSETTQSTATSASNCISNGDNTCSVTTSYTYDVYGNKLTTTVTGTSLPAPVNGSRQAVSGRTTTFAYDNQGEFVTEDTNPLGQSEYWSYDPRFGVSLSHEGPNGLTTIWSYDTLGRRVTETRADGTYTKYGYQYGSLGVANGAFAVQQSFYTSSNNQAAPSQTDEYDTLGRPIMHEVQAYNGSTSTFSQVDTAYNPDGQVAETSNPIFSGGAAIWTTYSYDALGRVVTAVKPYSTSGSTTTYGYNGLTSTVTDAQGRVTTTTDNDMGLPATVTDAAGSETTYTYDALGDLVQIEDPKGNITGYSYDVEGRKTGMVDPDRGQWVYGYDALGELSLIKDANNQTTTMQYDALGRMLTRTQSDQSDSWTYDRGANGASIGKLTLSNAYNKDAGLHVKQSYVYDNYGRLVTSTTIDPINSTSYSIETTYDAASRISTITYASGYVLTNYYSALGLLSSVAGTPAGSTSSTTLWTLNTNNAAGQITQETLGDNIVVSNSYDANTLGLVGTIAGLSSATQTGDSSSANVANLSYTYDDLGNLTGRSDADADTPNTGTAPAMLSETFGYDNLYRLTSEALPSVTKSFSYDALGNLTSKSDTGSYTYGNSEPHQVSSISCASGGSCQKSYNIQTSFTYDGNGNELTGDGYSTSWTTFNKPLTISQGNSEFQYLYDSDHNKAGQEGPNGSTAYLRDPNTGVSSELFTATSGASGITDYLFAGSEMIGIHVTPSSGSAYNRFFIRDHLGSIAAVTGDAGCSGLTLGASNSCLVERDSYDPWGKRRNAMTWADDINGTISSSTTRGFTGHEMVQNTSSGFELVDMRARFYDPLVGKFMSTDPIIQDATNLQDLNPYSYVLNNPLSLTDPNGEGFLSIFLDVLAVAVAIGLDQPEVLSFYAETLGLSSTGAAVFGAVIGGAAAGAISSGGSYEGALIGAISAGAFYGVGVETDLGASSAAGTAITSAGGSVYEASTGAYLAEAAGDGLVGGLSAVAAGGKFGSGFVAAGFSSLAGGELRAAGPGADNILSRGVLGGLGSILGGGKFDSGFVTGSFSYLYNTCQGLATCVEQGLNDASEDLQAGAEFALQHPVTTVEVVGTEIFLLGPEDPVAGALAGEEIAAAEGESGALANLANFRSELGLQPGQGTLARLDMGDQSFYGINAHGQEISLSVNAISRTHAEADVFQQAANAGINGGSGTLTVDRSLCLACGQNGGVASMARQLGLDSLTIRTPSSILNITP